MLYTVSRTNQVNVATSVDVKRVFSRGHLVLSHVRNGLSAQSTRAILCLSYWALSRILMPWLLLRCRMSRVMDPTTRWRPVWMPLFDCCVVYRSLHCEPPPIPVLNPYPMYTKPVPDRPGMGFGWVWVRVDPEIPTGLPVLCPINGTCRDAKYCSTLATQKDESILDFKILELTRLFQNVSEKFILGVSPLEAGWEIKPFVI